jgi:pulcherriminic acid synthase
MSPAAEVFNPYSDQATCPIDEFIHDPFPFWASLREHAPVWRHPQTGIYHVTRYRDVVGVFADSEHWSNQMYAKTLGVVFGPTMLQYDGREHVVRRTIIAPELVGKRLDGYKVLIERNAEKLIDKMRGRRQVDLVADFCTWLPVQVICDMLGLPEADMPFFHDCYQKMMAGLSAYEQGKRDAGIKAAHDFKAYCAPIVEERRHHPGSDFISRVVSAEVEGEKLGNDEVEAFLALLLTAGGETTDKAMSGMWAALLSDDDQIGQVKDDSTKLDPAFGETMRHSFPVLGQQRYCIADVEVAGTTIAARSHVNISIGSANNDPEIFDEPRRFDLNRSDLWLTKELRKGYDDGEKFGHLGFGLGKHFCAGYEMARVEAVISGQYLLDAFPKLRLVPGADVHPVVQGSTRAPLSVPALLD